MQMSKNRNRAKLNKAKSNKEYNLMLMQELYLGHIGYCTVCIKRSGSFFYDCHPSNLKMKHRHGNGRGISKTKYRSYKNWKYNRKTKWK